MVALIDFKQSKGLTVMAKTVEKCEYASGN